MDAGRCHRAVERVLVQSARRRRDAADDSSRTGPAGRSAEDAIRIRELQETVDELTRLRAAALEAAQRRDEFLTTISHELRSPLNAILGWTQVLEPRRDLPPDIRDALHVIRRNALRQRQLLDDLVDMSRVVSGALRIEPRPMRIQDALDEACQAVRPEMDRKGIHLDCVVDSPAIVSGDARRLQQVIRNLLSNAIRFTPTGGTISVRSTRGPNEVSLIISDTGAGIDPRSCRTCSSRSGSSRARCRAIRRRSGWGWRCRGSSSSDTAVA